MALVTLHNVSVGYGGQPVLEGVNLQIETGERISLVGRNGSGKSTLLKLLRGQMAIESGEMTRMAGLRVASLTQEVPHELHGGVYDMVAGGLGEMGTALCNTTRSIANSSCIRIRLTSKNCTPCSTFWRPTRHGRCIRTLSRCCPG